MKKLMFTAAAALCATVGLAIESANTVGYVDHTIAKSRKEMKGQSFQIPGGGSVNLNSLIAMKGNEVCEGGEFNLWWWNTDSNWGDKRLGNKYAYWTDYFYDPDDPDADEGFVFETGWAWYAADDEDQELPLRFTGDYAKTFAPGEGFFVQPVCDNPKLVCSGEIIGTDDTTSAMRKVAYTKSQKQLVTPPFPVAVALDDIVAMKGNEVCEGGEFNLWWWNTDSNWGDKRLGNKMAYWTDYYYAPDDPDADEGFVFETGWAWYAADDEDQELPLYFTGDYAKTFAVGEGFYIQPVCDNPYLAFPNVFKK